VGTFAQKIMVEAAVKRIKGVRGYVDDLAVRRQADIQSDDSIADRVANLIDWDVTLPKEKIKVKVDDGLVTLTGEVEWAYQRSGAEMGARRLPGVRGIINLITVKLQVRATDIKRRIEQALERQANVEADRVSISVEGGKVKLDGRIRAWFERDIIERAAWSTPGVQQVEDHLSIGG
jgi:osmotically-inducible protein OsmY